MRQILNRSRLFSYAAAALFSGLLLASCQKDENAVGNTSKFTPQEQQRLEKQMRDYFSNVKSIGIYNETMDKYVMIDLRNTKNGFSFSDPNPGFTFASNTGYYQQATADGTILFLNPGSSNAPGAGSGGVVTAGNSTLNIAYAFCFTANDEALGLDLLETDLPFDGVSGVIGIAGDFEALTSGEFTGDENPFDYFQGFAYYLVYDNEASGTYEVFDAFNIDDDGDDLEGQGFAWVLDFTENGGFYISTGGELTVSGGSISFEGTYLSWLNFFDLDEDDQDDVDGDDLDEVDGFGSMGC